MAPGQEMALHLVVLMDNLWEQMRTGLRLGWNGSRIGA